MLFKRVSIVGLGLLGGSWGLALKQNGFSGTVQGCDRRDVLQQALSRKVIDEGSEDITDAVRDADLVILATPVGAILGLLPTLQAAITGGALITDVGSTKRLICERASDVFRGAGLFLGGHPMAGRERSGLENADASLFRNSRYALTPLTPDDVSDPRVEAFIGLLTEMQALPFITDARAHDRAVAFLSHLPQLVSTGLASLIAEQSAQEPLPLELAGPGFRDITRLAESPYPLWRDICLTNRENIRLALTSLIQKLEDMQTHLNDRELERDFGAALRLRERLLTLT
ncbi:MAG: prephenate dehydrogenase [Bryobacteraceae bacterium]